eukprot:gb/GECG01012564.1/.p1 GENE.gb/GECG01012564.1/~~gb/GECG01012564.1/.p1  ORF type:complete len:107 (+),score=15.89 gb/GECG01012564.1/:1-321(+)
MGKHKDFKHACYKWVLQRRYTCCRPEARQAARQLKNRYSAAKSRLRKEAEIKQLRVELDQLRKDVEEKDQLLYRKDAVIQYLSEKLEMYESLESFSHPAHSKARKT